MNDLKKVKILKRLSGEPHKVDRELDFLSKNKENFKIEDDYHCYRDENGGYYNIDVSYYENEIQTNK